MSIHLDHWKSFHIQDRLENYQLFQDLHFGYCIVSKILSAGHEKIQLDGKYGPRRAKKGLKEVKNATKGPTRPFTQSQVVQSKVLRTYRRALGLSES